MVQNWTSKTRPWHSSTQTDTSPPAETCTRKNNSRSFSQHRSLRSTRSAARLAAKKRPAQMKRFKGREDNSASSSFTIRLTHTSGTTAPMGGGAGAGISVACPRERLPCRREHPSVAGKGWPIAGSIRPLAGVGRLLAVSVWSVSAGGGLPQGAPGPPQGRGGFYLS